MTRYFSIIIALLLAATCFAQSWDAANQAYSEGRYDDAALLYQSLIDEADRKSVV